MKQSLFYFKNSVSVLTLDCCLRPLTLPTRMNKANVQLHEVIFYCNFYYEDYKNRGFGQLYHYANLIKELYQTNVRRNYEKNTQKYNLL